MGGKRNDTDLVAAFLAKGGNVQRVAEGETNGMDRRDWRAATRGEPIRQRFTEEQLAEQRMERVREAYHVGGRSAALEAL
jgi:hypothetical protein